MIRKFTGDGFQLMMALERKIYIYTTAQNTYAIDLLTFTQCL